MTDRPPSRPTAAVLLLMAACAGVVDLWAITSLGRSYAGVVTGNLVSIGRAAGEARVSTVVPPLVAVIGFAVGVAVWSLAWRSRPSSVAGPLAAELVLLAGLAVAWPWVPGGPDDVPALVLLGVAAVAMGGQSSAALRLGASTTYLTGTLTGALAGAVTGGGWGRLSALRQLLALVLGAAAGALLLDHLRWSVPALAAVLLLAAVLVRAVDGRRRASRDAPVGCPAVGNAP